MEYLQVCEVGEAHSGGLHVFDAAADEYNVSVVSQTCQGLDVVLVEWCWRDQGLVLAPGNPLAVMTLQDIAAKQARVVTRQHEAGSQLLFVHLLAEAGMGLGDIDTVEPPARSETDVGLAVLEDKADAGLAIAAIAVYRGLRATVCASPEDEPFPDPPELAVKLCPCSTTTYVIVIA